ncbi:MAG: AI-2E family transporter, partial [Propionivibrio sp.]
MPLAGEAGARSAPEPEPTRLNVPVDVRSTSLVVIAVLMSVFALRWASEVIIPIMIGLMFSYALTPVVDFLQRWHLPRPLAAALLLLVLLSGVGWTVYTLRDDADKLIESLPQVAQQLRKSVRQLRGDSGGNIEQVQKAATQLELTAADTPTGQPVVPRGVARVQIEKPAFDIKDYLVVGAVHAAQIAGQTTIVVFITFFMLASGDAFRRKMARIAGPTFARRRITIQAMNEITRQIQRYFAVQLLTSVLVGLATGFSFWLLGMKHFAVWGIVAAVLDLVPYLGAMALAAASSVVALTQFGSIEKSILIAGICIGLHIVSGNIVTPYLTSRSSRLSTVVVFIGVLAWGWLWGVWGLLLGTPILMVVKA